MAHNASTIAQVWHFDFPSADDPACGWSVVTEFAGADAESAARNHLQSIRWRVAYGELFAVTIDGKKPLPVHPDCLPY